MTTPIFNSNTGHYYEFVAANTSWSAALQGSASKTYKGMAGYMVTITSSQEQQFITNYLNSFGYAQPAYFWAGGSDKDAEGSWTWASGPEAGKLMNLGYTNWFPGGVGYDAQPNGTWVQAIRDEDGLMLDSTWNYQWADLPTGDIGFQFGELVQGYVVEYGGMPATYRITKTATSVNEGSSVTFSIYTYNVEWGSNVTYSISGVNAADLSTGQLTGTALVVPNGSEGLATVTLNLVQDFVTDGQESLVLTIGSTSSSVVVNDTSLTPNYEISSSAAAYNEGNTAVFTIRATGVPAGTAAQYTLSGLSNSDITGPMAGHVAFSGDGTATLSVPLVADQLTEGTETLTLLVGSAKSSVTINDTSKTPTYVITSTSPRYDEGVSASFTLSTTNLASGTLVPYTLSGISNTDTTTPLTGNLSIGSDGKATLLVPLIADALSEGTEVLVLTAGSSAKSVLVIDTSLAPTYALAASSSSYNEGSTASFRLITNNLAVGTVLSYTLSGISSNDTSTSLTGTLTIGNDLSATLNVPLTPDNLLEGNETLRLTVAGVSASTQINDTSKSAVFSLSATQAAFNEGATVTFRLNTTRVADGYILPYTITGVTAADLVYGISGNLRIGSTGENTVAIPLNNDMLTEGPETLVLSIAGLTSSVTINDTSLSPSFVITTTSSTYDEGTNLVFSIASTHADAGTSVPYALTGVSALDVGVPLTGNLIVGNDGLTTLTVPILADLFTEGSETLRLTLAANAPLSVATADISIIDSSRTPKFQITASSPSFDEGSTVNFKIEAAQVAPGLAVLYTFSGLSREDFTGAASGTVMFDSDGLATLSLNLVADATTEGPESLTLSVGSSLGTVIVNDTSKSPVFSITSSASAYNEGSTAFYTVNALNVPEGLVVTYSISGLNDTDFEGATTGNITLDADRKAVLSIPITADRLTEGTETLTLTVAGVSKSVLINDSSNRIAYAVSSITNAVNEGTTAQFIISTVDLPEGSVVPYTLTGISQEDLVGFVSTNESNLSGNATLNAQGQAQVSLRLASDKRTEGIETLTLRLNAITPGSGLANNSSASVSVLDTSILPTLNLTSAQSALDEGDTARMVVTTTGLETGTALSYTISGVTSADVLSGLTGNVLLDSQGRATINVVTIADNATEGTENLTLTLRYADNTTPLSAALSVSVRDSSLTPTPPVVPPTEKVITVNAWQPTTGADVFTWVPNNLPVQLNGLGGTDKLVVNGLLKDFTVSANGASSQSSPLIAPLNVAATFTQSSSKFSVNLQNIERLQFSDFNLALDTLATNGPGKAALIAGAVFGPASARDAKALGALISMLDTPSVSDLQVANFALKLMLGNNPSYKSVVDMLYQNVTGVYPNAVEEANYVRLLDTGVYTPGSLALFAANHELNKTKIGFVGIVEQGLIYQVFA
ncbi:MAG: hypothetical protein RL650_277 [Pseudomonadota bacterium]|jgi:hypothetical protein